MVCAVPHCECGAPPPRPAVRRNAIPSGRREVKDCGGLGCASLLLLRLWVCAVRIAVLRYDVDGGASACAFLNAPCGGLLFSMPLPFCVGVSVGGCRPAPSIGVLHTREAHLGSLSQHPCLVTGSEGRVACFLLL
ncbi:hypothetical protein TcCL_Unassigned01990 [Trypanosoma cruzi]|nr:hypothetical protein TcCL_Unassigned01990 [Trypanosoma cruzi]